MQLQEKLRTYDKESSPSVISVADSEVSSRSDSSPSGYESVDMDDERCGAFLRKPDRFSDFLLFSDIFPGVDSETKITNNVGNALPSSPPFAWPFLPRTDSSDWQLVDPAYFADVCAATLEPDQPVSQYPPSDISLFPLTKPIEWTEELFSVKAPIDDISGTVAPTETISQKRRRRPNLRPILKGPNKYGRLGNLRCEFCRGRKQKVDIYWLYAD